MGEWVALRTMKTEEGLKQPGDIIKNAAFWRNRVNWERQGWIAFVPDGMKAHVITGGQKPQVILVNEPKEQEAPPPAPTPEPTPDGPRSPVAEPEVEKVTYECISCERRFQTEHALKIHNARVHAE